MAVALVFQTINSKLLLVAIFAALGAFGHGLVAGNAQFVVGNFLVDLDLLDATLVALGAAQGYVLLVGEGNLAKGTTLVLIGILSSGKGGTSKGNYGKHCDNSFFHCYYLLVMFTKDIGTKS